MSTTRNDDPSRSRARGWTRRAWLGAGLATIGAVGAASWLASAPALARAFGHGPMHRGWFGPHHDHDVTTEEIRDHVSFLLRGVDASDDQVDRIAAIAESTLRELRSLREAHAGAREAVTAALAGASVDRAALEQLRSDHLAAAETASRRITQALADAAEVLTPEQRAKLAEEHARMHRWHD
jgi:Spy/CpxP family protein refolding chaperone